MSAPFEKFSEITSRRDQLMEVIASGVDPEIADLYAGALEKLTEEQSALLRDPEAVAAAQQADERAKNLIAQLEPLRGIIDEKILTERAERYASQAASAASFLVAHQTIVSEASVTPADEPVAGAVELSARPAITRRQITKEDGPGSIVEAIRTHLSGLAVGAEVKAEEIGRLSFGGLSPAEAGQRYETRRALTQLVLEGVIAHNGVRGRGSRYVVTKRPAEDVSAENPEDSNSLFSIRDAGLLASQLVRFAETLQKRGIALPSDDILPRVLDAQPNASQHLTAEEISQARLQALSRLDSLLQDPTLLGAARDSFGSEDPRSAFLDYLQSIVRPETYELLHDLIESVKLLDFKIDDSKYGGQLLSEVVANADKLVVAVVEQPSYDLGSLAASEAEDARRAAEEYASPSDVEIRELRKLTKQLDDQERTLAIAAYNRLRELRQRALDGGLEFDDHTYAISYLDNVLSAPGLHRAVREARQAHISTGGTTEITVAEALKAILYANKILEAFVLVHKNGDQLVNNLVKLAMSDHVEFTMTRAQVKRGSETTARAKAEAIKNLEASADVLVRRFFIRIRELGHSRDDRMAPHSYKDLLGDSRLDSLVGLLLESGILQEPPKSSDEDERLKITLDEAILASLFGNSEHSVNIRRWPYDVKQAIATLVEKGFEKQRSDREIRKSRNRAGKGRG